MRTRLPTVTLICVVRTLRTALLTLQSDAIPEAKATDGDTHLSGEDPDKRIVDFCNPMPSPPV